MRLIDADELKKAFKKIYHIADTMEELANTMEDAIDNAPTVEQKYYERVIAQINPVIEARPQMIGCFNCEHDGKTIKEDPCKYCVHHDKWRHNK